VGAIYQRRVEYNEALRPYNAIQTGATINALIPRSYHAPEFIIDG